MPGTQNEALRRMMKITNNFLGRSDCAPFHEPVDWRLLELWDYPKIIKKMMDLGTVKRKLERGEYDTAFECAEDIRLIWSNCMTYNADGSDFFLLAEYFSKKFEERYKKIQQEFDTGEDMDDGEAEFDIDAQEENEAEDGGGGKSSQDQNSSSSGAKYASLEQRTRFGANLFRLTGMQLGHVLMKLDLNCPKALESPSYLHDNNDVDDVDDENDSTNNDDDTSEEESERDMSSSLRRILDGEQVEINVDLIDAKTFAELDAYVKEKMLLRKRNGRSTLGSSSNQNNINPATGTGTGTAEDDNKDNEATESSVADSNNKDNDTSGGMMSDSEIIGDVDSTDELSSSAPAGKEKGSKSSTKKSKRKRNTI